MQLWSQRYEISFEGPLLTKARQALGAMSITISEASFLSVVVDKSLSEVEKAARLEKAFAKVRTLAKTFGTDIKKEILPCIVSLGVGRVLN